MDYPTLYTSQLRQALGPHEIAGADGMLARVIAKGAEIDRVMADWVQNLEDLKQEIAAYYPPGEACPDELDQRYCWLDELQNDLRVTQDTVARIVKGETPEQRAARMWRAAK